MKKEELKQFNYMETKKIDSHILELLTPEGFEKQFNLFCCEYNTGEEAYEATERMYINHFKKRRYSDYHSFKNSRNERKRKSRKNDKR